MTKLYTWTPNPALDLSGHVRSIVPNEKNYVFSAQRDPGGNGVNAARIAARLGVNVQALGFLGGATGDELLDLLHQEKVVGRFTRIRGLTRTNVTVTNDSVHKQTRLTFPGPKIRPSEIQSFLGEIKRLHAPGILIIGGSLPEGCPKNFHRAVGHLALKKGLGVAVDVPSKFMPDLLRDTSLEILFIKPNLTELEEWVGNHLSSDAKIKKALLLLSKRVGLACVSLGEEGAYFAVQDSIWRGTSPHVKIRGTVGAGDSMVGAICSRLVHHRVTQVSQIHQMVESAVGIKNLKSIFQWGLAAGAATAGAEGTTLGQAATIKKLVSRAKIREVKI